jgi:hypothetical protein
MDSSKLFSMAGVCASLVEISEEFCVGVGEKSRILFVLDVSSILASQDVTIRELYLVT